MTEQPDWIAVDWGTSNLRAWAMTAEGRVLDEARASVRQITDHAVPVLDETAATIASANTQLGKVESVGAALEIAAGEACPAAPCRQAG